METIQKAVEVEVEALGEIIADSLPLPPHRDRSKDQRKDYCDLRSQIIVDILYSCPRVFVVVSDHEQTVERRSLWD